MITLTTIRRLIDQTQRDYEKCWKFLSSWKARELIPSLDELLDFQPRLAIAIFRLGEMHQSLARERKSLISRKRSLSAKWFKRRMKRLSEYQDALTEVIKIGKVIGDSFAWIFYQGERRYLSKHFAHQPIFQIPSGLGGKGEIAFIKKHGVLNGQFTIYHGITSFLRIGDVSFYEPKSKKITGIGELKTATDTGSSLGMTLYLLWPRASETVWPRQSEPSKTGANTKLPFGMEERLKRQLKTMASSLDLPKRGKLIKIRDESHLSEINKVAEGLGKKTIVVEKAGDGLLLFGFRSDRQKSLYSRLLLRSKADLNKWMDGIENHIHRITDMSQIGSSSNANRTFLGILDLSAFPGTTPMFWWPVPSEFVRKLIFHEMTVVTVYNPGHLVRKLRALGFEVQLSGTKMRVAKTVGMSRLEMGSMHHFLHYIQQHLMREDFLLATFQKIVRRVEAGEILPNTQIDLDTQLFY